MKTLILLFAAALSLPCAAQTPAKDLAKLADDMVEREFDLQPLRETWSEGRGPHAGKAAIPPTAANVAKAQAVYRELLARLSAIPKDGLGTIDRNTHEMIRIRIQDQLEETRAPLDAMQLLAPTSGYLSQLIFMSTAGQPMDTEADFEAWLSRVEESATNIDGVITAIEEAKRAGWTTPRVLVEKALVQLATIADKPADQGPMWSRVAKYPKDAGEAKRADFEKRYREALEKRFIPAVKRLATFAREKYLPEARTTSGIGVLPGGEAAYRERVRASTTLDLTPEQVHARGLAEMDRIRPKLLEVAGRLGFKGTIKDLPGWIQASPSNYPFNTADEILVYLRKVQARVTPELPKLFKRLPKAALDVRLTPKELAATASASYSSPPIDNSRPGYFNMPVVDAKKRAVFDLTDLFLHEGVPGHHLDSALRRELTELPRFRRNSWITAYGEGWGLYAESLGGELGVYDDDWALLGYYTAELQRAARLVVDTGLHSKGWTREQGIKYLVEERGSFEPGAIVEVERYMAWPGQALAYKIGQLEIIALRDAAKAKLGARFDIREFHEAVLGEGPLPLPLLRRRVEAWIGAQAQGQPLSAETQRFRAIYQEFIEINSSHSGGGTTKVAQAAQAHLLAAGFAPAEVEVLEPFPQKGNLLARFKGTGAKRPLLLLGHIDVVEARREDWKTDPFKLQEKDGVFTARGAIDDKAMASSYISVLSQLKREGFRPNRDIILALTADEERGSAGTNGGEWLLKERRKDVDAEFGINEGGRGEIRGGKPITHVMQTGEKTYLDYELEATGPGAHSARPTPDNTLYDLAEALVRLRHYRFPVQLNDSAKTYFQRSAPQQQDPVMKADFLAVAGGNPSSEVLERLSNRGPIIGLLRTTCVATMAQAGHAPNAQAQSAKATVNCRALPGDDVSQITAKLKEIAGPKVQVKALSQERSAPGSPLRADLMQPVERITAEMWPGVPVVPTMGVSSTDSRQFRAAGIPMYGVSGLFVDPDDTGVHGLNEHIGVQQLYDGREFMYRLIKALASEP